MEVAEKHRPNFFIVGAAKAGTSSLHDCFGRHPEIFMSTLKEPNHFADDLDLPYRVADRSDYLELFEIGRAMKVRGEASASYLVSVQAASNIHRFSTEARVLISLRNPVDALISHHAEARRWGVEPQRDIGRAVVDFLPSMHGQRRRSGPPYLQLVQYADQVERYFEAFPPERRRVIVFEEWKAEPDRVLGTVLDFLGVEPEVPPLRIVGPARQFRTAAIQRIVMTPPRWLPSGPDHPLADRFLRFLWRLNRDRRPRPLPDPIIRRQLSEYFEPEVRRLESLLGRELRSVWHAAD